MPQRLGMSKMLKEMVERENDLSYKLNQVNSLMRIMKEDGYRLTVVDGKTKVAWIKIGEGR